MAQYGKAAYWDDRYTKQPEQFDWYQRFSGLKDMLGQYVRKDDNILMLGAGNSRLSEDMYTEGYETITNIDISRVCIDQMQQLYQDKPALIWQQMNACALEFPDESFNAVIDKGTLDSVLCGEGSTANVAKLCMEVSRCLTPSGVYVIISYGIQENRLQYLENDDYRYGSWCACSTCFISVGNGSGMKGGGMFAYLIMDQNWQGGGGYYESDYLYIHPFL
ncbi:unnamed protein product [Chrysoparadoxa australica]